MTTNAAESMISLTQEQIEVFADGLYYIATLDGVHENEIQVIREFLTEVDHADYGDKLASSEFSIERASRVLDTSYLRRLFLKACLVTCMSDHVLTDLEQETLDFLTRALDAASSLDELKSTLDGSLALQTS